MTIFKKIISCFIAAGIIFTAAPADSILMNNNKVYAHYYGDPDMDDPNEPPPQEWPDYYYGEISSSADYETSTFTVQGCGSMAWNTTYGFSPNEKMKHIVISDGITDITEKAFMNWDTIESVEFTDSITKIYSKAFLGCSSLESFSIPDSIICIGRYAFTGCDNICESVGGITYVDNWAVDISDNLPANVSIRPGTRGIAESLFEDCTSLKSVYIPDSVIYIGDKAFKNCTGIKKITVPDSTAGIGRDSFENCNVNRSTANGVRYIGKCAVGMEDTSIKHVTFLPGTRGIGDYAFCCYYIESLCLPDSVIHIGDWAYNGCSILSKKVIYLPEGIISIGDEAFGDCSIRVMFIPDSIISIGHDVFEYDPEFSIPTKIIYSNKCSQVNVKDAVCIPGESYSKWDEEYDYEYNYLTEMITITVTGPEFHQNEDDLKKGKSIDKYMNASKKIYFNEGVSNLHLILQYHCTDIYVPQSVENIDFYNKIDLPISDCIRVHGIPDSYAQTFAEENNIEFIPDYQSEGIEYGDLDFNFSVDMTDLTILSQYLMGDITILDYQAKAADVTGNGETDIADLAALRQYIMKDDIILGPQPDNISN